MPSVEAVNAVTNGGEFSRPVKGKWDQIVSVGIPVPRFAGYNVDASDQTLQSLMDMYDYSNGQGIKVLIIPRIIGRGLNVASNHMKLANTMRGDWLLIIGSDHTFEKDALWKLIEAATDDDGECILPIIGGITSSRVAPFRLIGYRRDKHGKNYLPIRFGVDFTEEDILAGTVLSGTHIGTGSGFTLYHRSVFDEVQFPWFDNGVRVQDLGDYGPDIRICREAVHAGIPTALHCGVIYQHWDFQPIHPYRYLSWLNEGEDNWMPEMHVLNNEGATEQAVQNVVEMNRENKERRGDNENSDN